MTTDLLVIGAGWSGLLAAYTAAKAGLQVQVVAKGLGSMHWAAGTVDVMGYTSEEMSRPVQQPLEAIQGLAATHPDHPYALLGAEQVQTALDTFKSLAAELGLPYSGAATAGDNLLLPSAVGALRPTYLAPQAQLAGDASRPEPQLIVGFHGLRDFYPELIAENLAKQGFTARAAFLPLSVLTEQSDRNNVHLAEGLDDKGRRAKLGSELKRLARPGERIGLPAILGLDDHAAAFADLQTAAGVPLFEIPTLPPSVPGMRLFKALRARLWSMGVRLDAGMEAIGASTTPAVNGTAGRVQWVETATTSRPLKNRAKNYLLATGGILGGGFDSDHTGRLWETVFDLPLTIPQKRYEWFRPEFMNPAGHPVFNGGVAVNVKMQPCAVDAAGKVVYANLWAAGGALASVDPIQQHSLEGIAIASGMAAAQAIVRVMAQ
ncbi:MAG TPA: glycerol-3-phosphate dehydrogenase subunit GlpB [Anaerolineae bacterium]|nr:glycerol-3-phosphate dehydrogenase subunit GlpB [Anaerolineae bacterium]